MTHMSPPVWRVIDSLTTQMVASGTENVSESVVSTSLQNAEVVQALGIMFSNCHFIDEETEDFTVTRMVTTTEYPFAA